MFHMQVKLSRIHVYVGMYETELEECRLKSCVIGRFVYEDKYRSEPSFVIAKFMWQTGGTECLCFPPLLKKDGGGGGGGGGCVHAD